MRKSVLEGNQAYSDPEKNMKLRLFSFLLLMSIVAISVMLAACIGKTNEGPHFAVVIIDFANMGMVVWGTNSSKILNPC